MMLLHVILFESTVNVALLLILYQIQIQYYQHQRTQHLHKTTVSVLPTSLMDKTAHTNCDIKRGDNVIISQNATKCNKM